MRISDWSSDVCSSDLADALLLAHHGQQPFWLRGGNRGDLCRRAAGRDQAVLQGEVVAADAVPDRACVAAGDVRLAAREHLNPVLAGESEPGAHVMVVVGDVAGAESERAAIGGLSEAPGGRGGAPGGVGGDSGGG